MAKAQPERRSIAPVRVLRTLVAQKSNARDESDRKFRRRCRFFSFEPLFRSHRQDRHLSCEVMNDSSPGQLILCGVPGKELDVASAELFRRVQPGGFILFGRNIESAPQLRRLIDDLRDLSSTEPIITIDQEGGRVSRLRLIGNEPPNAQQLRDKGDVDLIHRHGDITGRLLRIFGFNLDLCPVLDISFDDNADNSLRGRCYGKTVEQVVRKAGAFNDAMRKQGIASCCKHFPGYSAAKSDAHYELPKIDRTREELDANELAVFRKFIGRGGSPNRPRAIEVNRPYLEEGIIDSMMI